MNIPLLISKNGVNYFAFDGGVSKKKNRLSFRFAFATRFKPQACSTLEVISKWVHRSHRMQIEQNKSWKNKQNQSVFSARGAKKSNLKALKFLRKISRFRSVDRCQTAIFQMRHEYTWAHKSLKYHDYTNFINNRYVFQYRIFKRK